MEWQLEGEGKGELGGLGFFLKKKGKITNVFMVVGMIQCKGGKTW